MKTPTTLFAIGLLLLASTTLSGASPSYTLAPDVLASGGQRASSANYSLTSTVGQPLIGPIDSATYSICSGFWCEIEARYGIYLPLLLKIP